MAGSGPKGVVADLPIHPVGLKQAAEGQPPDRESALVLPETRPLPSEQHVQVVVDPSQPIHRQVAEKVVTLNRKRHSLKYRTILRIFDLDEVINVAVREEAPLV